jgi:hypothetical protein
MSTTNPARRAPNHRAVDYIIDLETTVVDKETPRRYPKFSRDGDESDGCAVRYARRPAGAWRLTVIILGIILLVVGFLLGIPILWTLGVILVVIGLILVVLGSVGHAVGGRRHYF